MLENYIKELKIGNIVVKNNVFLAPMAGVTDIPFRKICREFGPGLTFTEMASSKAMEFNSKKTSKILNIITAFNLGFLNKFKNFFISYLQKTFFLKYSLLLIINKIEIFIHCGRKTIYSSNIW